MAEVKKTAAPTEAPYDPMKDMVPVFLPRASAKAENFVLVGLNGKAYKIMRGTEVRVPRPVYDILRESTRMQDKADAYNRAQIEYASRRAEAVAKAGVF